MKSVYRFTLATALVLCPAAFVPAAAQTTAPAVAPPAAEMAEGEIRKISKDTGKLTIKHGPIKSLDMPPMTMVFTAKDPAMLATVAVGDKVRFVAVDQDGKMLVTHIQPAR